jgi:hypothetical protein
MRARVVVLISLVLNVALAIALWRGYQTARELARQARTDLPSPVVSNSTFRVAKTNVILKPGLFSWHTIESSNYDHYVLNLRGIGCPESTVRDIIVADVNQLYARRRKELSPATNDIKWWSSEPDLEEVQTALARQRVLEQERRALLTRLLGTNWEQSADKEPEPVVLAGPVLGGLTREQKEAVQQIVARSRFQVEDYLKQCEEAGEMADPIELARLREQTRHELGEQLNKEELEEFLLRYSNNALQLRGELRGLNATPEEFRKVFAAIDPIDRQFQFLGSDEDPTTAAERKRLEEQRDAAIRQALGLDRYDAYRMLNDADYRAALVDAREAGAPAQAGRGLYEINQAADSERERLREDASLSEEQRKNALKLVDQQQKAARAALLGLPLPEEATTTPAPANVFQHQAGPHDTLAGLSLYYRVPLSDLLRANPGLDAGTIQPGRAVKIPEPAALPWRPGIVPQR